MARVREYGVDETGAPSSVLLGCAIGDIIPHFGTTPPPGTLVCDGSEISRETYHELYDEIGALCGPGDGNTTFELPDLRDVWLVWAGTQRGAGAKVVEGLPNISGGSPSTNILTDSMRHANHSGEESWLETIGCVQTVLSTHNILTENTTAVRDQIFSFNIDASRSSPIYGASTHVTPASVAVLPCIVYE